ncbi:MAG: CrcB family protein [Candidatus Cohnella colombiensis]|uniref:Fluoride-specific ion channel FluC n=1 Tax=Candidatus Cohnella colombiensis TaxID=3121368 RepID=A0AA95F1D6_9BACL|nr:MAG: CrcB family protein [Cohnella sp.]
MRLIVAVGVAGFMGAVLRYEIGLWFTTANGASAFPWPTLFVNLTGSFLLGLLFGYASTYKVPHWFKEAAGTGFLGAYTTFSAFSGQLWQLIEGQNYSYAIIYVLLSGVGGWIIATAGYSLGLKGRAV